MSATSGPESVARGRSDVRTLARGGGLNLAGLFASAVLQFALVVVVTRGLGAEGAGIFLEALALFMIISHSAELGANTGLVRTIPRYRALGRASDVRGALVVALSPVALVGALAGLATFLLAPHIADVFFHGVHRGDVVTYIRLLAVFIPLASATTVALAGTRGFGTMIPYVVVQNVGIPAARLVLVLAAVAGGLGIVAVGLAWSVPLACGLAAAGVILVRLVRSGEDDAESVGESRPLGALAADFWAFTAPRALAATLGVTGTWLGILLVGALASTKEAAIYAAASRFVIVGAYALQAVGMAIAPQISALFAEDARERIEDLYRLATWWLMALSWPVYATMAVFAPFLMGIFGPEFVAGKTALLILSLAMLVNLGTGNVTMVLLMGGKSSWNLFNAVVALTVNVMLNVLLVPTFGASGAAVAWAASLVFVNVAPVFEVRFLLGLRPPFGTGYLLVALATAAAYGGLGLVVRSAFGMSLASFTVFALVATAVYAVLLWRLRAPLQLPQLREALRARRPASDAAASAVE